MYVLQLLLVAVVSNLGTAVAASTSVQPTTSPPPPSSATSSLTVSSSSVPTVSPPAAPTVQDVPPPLWARDNTVLLTATNISTTTGQLPEGLRSYSLRCTKKAVCETAHNKAAIAFSKGYDDLNCTVQTWAAPNCKGKTEVVPLGLWKQGVFGSFSFECGDKGNAC